MSIKKKDRHNGVYAYCPEGMLHFLTDKGWDELRDGGLVDGKWLSMPILGRHLFIPEEYLL